MNKCFSFLLTGAAVTLLAGCTTLFDKDNTPVPAKLTPLPPTAKSVAVLWQTNTGQGAGSEYPGLTPAISGQRIFAAARSGQITALDRQNGKMLWQTPTGFPLSAGVGVNQHQVFAAGRGGKLIALDQTTGKTLWSADVSQGILASPTASDTRVVVKSIDNRVTAFSALSGKKLWSVFEKQPELILQGAGSPQFGNGSVFAGLEDGTLARYSVTDGSLYWKQTIADPEGIFPIQRMVDMASDPVVARYHVFAATWQGRLASINIHNGAINWSRPVSTFTTPAFDGNAVYASNAKGHIQAFNAHNGRVLWHQKSLTAHRLTGPVVDGHHLVVGDAEGWIHVFNKSNGALVTRYFAGGNGVYAAPLVLDHTLYIATRSGQLIACRTPL